MLDRVRPRYYVTFQDSDASDSSEYEVRFEGHPQFLDMPRLDYLRRSYATDEEAQRACGGFRKYVEMITGRSCYKASSSSSSSDQIEVIGEVAGAIARVPDQPEEVHWGQSHSSDEDGANFARGVSPDRANVLRGGGNVPRGRVEIAPGMAVRGRVRAARGVAVRGRVRAARGMAVRERRRRRGQGERAPRGDRTRGGRPYHRRRHRVTAHSDESTDHDDDYVP
jgi:hypothetical protein